MHHCTTKVTLLSRVPALVSATARNTIGPRRLGLKLTV